MKPMQWQKVSGIILLAFALCFALSCKTDENLRGDSGVATVRSALTTIDESAGSAQAGVEALEPSATDETRPIVAGVRADLKNVRIAVTTGHKGLNKVSTNTTALIEERDAAQESEAKAKTYWGYRAGKWLTKMFWIFVIGYFALGIFSAWAGVAGPATWLFKIGRAVTNFLPLANIFTGATKLITKCKPKP